MDRFYEFLKIDFVKKIAYAFFVLLIYFFIFEANLLNTITNEDFDLYVKGQSFSAVFEACKGQYLHWNARIGDVLSLILSTLPTIVFDIINSLTILALIFTIFYIASLFSDKKISLFGKLNSVTFIFLGFIFFIQKPGEIFLWRTGSANYLYPGLFSFLYIIPFLYYILKKEDLFERIKNSILKITSILLYIIVGIVVAHGNENISPTMLLFFILTIIYIFIKERKFKVWMILSTTLFLIGMYLLIFGPSTTYRIKFYASVYHITSSPPMLLLMNFNKTSMMFLDYNKWLLFISVSLFFFVSEKKKYSFVFLMFLLTSFLTAIILAAAPYQEPRAFFATIILMMVPVVFGFLELSSRAGLVLLFLLLFFVMLESPFLSGEYHNMQARFKAKNERIRIVFDEKEKASGDIKIPPMLLVSTPLVLVGGTSDEAERMSRSNLFNLNGRKIIIDK